MWRNVFTSNIISNRLNFQALFKPIIYFSKIGKPL
ncbi:hypothetical protein KP509_29G003600 [Ceratopteris richardii]|uniref:Uncharacterized protein n=1 Tax=Ceratopteris richardii TaxID=49495 RepID=A0A8T2R605_CERRI|nr:hypothetical protein KP509_29G003600 [Ceratopteris richardii]